MIEPKGFLVKNQMVSLAGSVLFPGTLKQVSQEWRQPTPGTAPVEYLDFEANATVNGEKLKWAFSLTRSEASFGELTDSLQKRMPEGISIGKNTAALVSAIDALSGPNSAEEFPIRHYETWHDNSGTFYNGKKVANVPIEIVGEPGGEYRLRVPAADGNGHVYADGLRSDVLGGRLPVEIANGSGITDPIRLGMSLTTAWNRLSAHQRSNLEKEDLTQQRREATRHIDTRLQRLA
jgi:hypothetical protein